MSLGEVALEIQIARFSRSLAASQVDILVLGMAMLLVTNQTYNTLTYLLYTFLFVDPIFVQVNTLYLQ